MADAAQAGASRRAASAASNAKPMAIEKLRQRTEFDQRVAGEQIVDRRRMDIDARDRAAAEFGVTRRGRRQRTARSVRMVQSRRKALRSKLAVLGIEQRAEDHHLAFERAPEKLLVVAADAAVQIGQRIGLDVGGAAVEIQRHGILDRAGNAVTRQRHAAVLADDGLRLLRARRQLQRHRGDRPLLACKGELHASDDVVGVGVDVERANVLLLADGDTLSGRGTHCAVVTQHLAEHDLARIGAGAQRQQEGTVETAQLRAQDVVAKGKLGLLDRIGKDDVEARNLGAAVEHRGQHPAYLGGPGRRRRPLEGCRRVGLLVDRDDGNGRSRGIVADAETVPAQRREDVDGPAMEMADRWKRRDDAAQQGDQENRDGVPPDGAHARFRLAVMAALKRDKFRMKRRRALALCLSMTFSENRFALFRIMP